MSTEPDVDGNDPQNMPSEPTHPALLQLHAALTKLRQAPRDMDVQQVASQLIKDLANQGVPPLEAYHPVTYELLLDLLSGNVVAQQSLARIALSQLMSKYQIGTESDPAETGQLLITLARDRLLLEVLKKTVNTDRQFEVFLRKLRRVLLFESRGPAGLRSELFPLAAALAQQCFNNEYIFIEEDDERIAVDDVEATCARALGSDPAQVSERLLLVLGMYRSLSRLPSADRILEIPLATFAETVRPVVVRMVQEPLEENRLQDDIVSFGAVTSATSKMVRDQYEDNPYPRWFSLGGPFSSLENRLKRIRPEFSWPHAFRHQKIQILVPGCGTGQQPLALASGNPDADVVAIDLSKASLAYARRMAGVLGLRT